MSQVFFNEIHYENIGFDKNEGVEIAGPAGTVLDGWRLSVYDGKGQHHGDLAIRGLIPDEKNGFGVVYISVALPNAKGGHGLALVNKSNDVVDFISWNTVVDATGGPASGKKSFKIPVHEDVFTRASHSLQLAGEGNKSSDFKWQAARSNSFGKINAGQTFVKASKPAQPPVEPTSPPPEPRPSPGPVTPQVLQGLDLLVEKNRREHRTDKFHAADYFAVRRGQIFEVALEAPAPVTQALIKFTVYPETNQHTTVQVSTSEAGNKETEWFAFFAGVAGGKTVVAISIPGRATVGQYTISASGDNGKTWTPPQPCYILFNAWSKFDDVFLDNEAERAEYVLGEDGYIWVGSYFNFGPRPWSFSQFNSKSLQAALALLQKIPLANRGDIVLVSRALSALMNSQDDRGVIVGNWSSDYSGGKSPSSWTGSADILKQYLSTGAPVKFGQCWVYSGTLTTVCRALGIPCRPVTNFASAHDVPDPKYNRSVDKYFLADGVTEDTEKTNDSVWNFHVWNDAWMARRDLGSSAYTGWQAIDGTPQEISGGKYQMGPVPLIAVKHGEKNINYDLEFVFSEVNADEKYYVADGRGGYRLVRTITDSIGLYTSTKAVGSSARNDITLEYKYKEKSPEERASHSADKSGDVKVILSVDQTTKLGKTIQAKLSATATSKESTLRIQFTAGIVTYTGKPVVTLESKTVTVKAAPGTPVNVPFELTPERYVPQLKGTNGILFRAFVWVPETEQATVVQEEFDFVADDIEIELPAANTLVAGRDVNVTVKFTNPLPITLTNLDLSVEGTDLTKVQHFKFAEVKPGQTLSQVVPLYLWKSGKKLLIAMLDSAQINDLRGHIELIVN